MRNRLLPILLLAACSSGPPIPPPRPLPPGATFAGRWESSFGPVVLDQRDDWVFGTFGKHGTIFGKAKGDQLRFSWKEQTGDRTGRGYWVLATDGARMDGRFGEGKGEVEKGPCWAKRAALARAPAAAAPAPPGR